MGGLLRNDARVHLFVVSDNDRDVAVTRQELVGADYRMDFMAHCIVDTLGTINDPMICGEEMSFNAAVAMPWAVCI